MFGKVTRWFDDRGDGFSYFLHKSNLDGEHVEYGYYVSFRTFANKKGANNAKDIIVIEAPERGK